MDETIGQYIEEHAVDGVLPVEDMEKLTLAAMGGGDVDAATSGDTESGDAPDPEEAKTEETPEPKEEEAKEPEPEEATEPEAEPVIVAKDGRNTIPYSELADAREAAQNERNQRVALERELAALKAALKAKHDGGGDAEDGEAEEAEGESGEEENADIAKLREDWPEVAAPVEGLLAKQQAQIRALQEQIARLAPTTEQLEQERQRQAHIGAITEAHPDAMDIVNSKEFADWRESLPDVALLRLSKNAFDQIVRGGTTESVIALLDEFKLANPNWGKSAAASDNAEKAPSKDPTEREAAVKAAREKAAEKKSTPKSLSDIPGAEAAPTDNIEAIMQKAPEDRMRALMNMTPEQLGEIRRRMT